MEVLEGALAYFNLFDVFLGLYLILSFDNCTTTLFYHPSPSHRCSDTPESSVFCSGCSHAWEQQIDAAWFGNLGLLFRNHTGRPQPFLKQRQHISKASSLIHRLHPERDGFCVCVCVFVCTHTDQARGDGTITVKKQSNGHSVWLWVVTV